MSMEWERASAVTIDNSSFYLVQTNGGEWRDFDLELLKGPIVSVRLRPEYVRGRPVWIAKITRPDVDQKGEHSDGLKKIS